MAFVHREINCCSRRQFDTKSIKALGFIHWFLILIDQFPVKAPWMFYVDDSRLVSLVCDLIGTVVDLVITDLKDPVDGLGDQDRFSIGIRSSSNQSSKVQGKGDKSFFARFEPP